MRRAERVDRTQRVEGRSESRADRSNAGFRADRVTQRGDVRGNRTSVRSDVRGNRADNRRDNARNNRNDGRRDAARSYHRDDRSRYGNDRRDYRRWDRGWRSNRSYNWADYRRGNHFIYRPGAYYAPYRSHRYSRLQTGFYLNSLFFQQRFYINDPYAYRLPPAYAPYQWVRYYDDVVMVDTYTGEVVDVIYDFFW